MIAPFWDDLTTQGEGRVYAWEDEANHLAVIEWSRLQPLSSSVLQTFEVILFDVDYYPTPTGDGEILFQYHTITEVQGGYADNAYSTIGIESHDQLVGIEVVYSLLYRNPTIAPLQNSRAYFFTTRFEYNSPWGDLQVTLTPVSPPIVIPAIGGSFDFVIGAENSGENPLVADVWCQVLLPNGSYYGPVLGPAAITLNAGTILERNRTQIVPGAAPAGDYQYLAYIGTYPNVVYDSSSFDFSKRGVQSASPNCQMSSR
jgi:hypothetical protein